MSLPSSDPVVLTPEDKAQIANNRAMALKRREIWLQSRGSETAGSPTKIPPTSPFNSPSKYRQTKLNFARASPTKPHLTLDHLFSKSAGLLGGAPKANDVPPSPVNPWTPPLASTPTPPTYVDMSPLLCSPTRSAGRSSRAPVVSSLLRPEDADPPETLVNRFVRPPRDAHRRLANNPEYDPTTLYINPNELASFSEPRRQYWEIKAANFDECVIFQQGDFFNLYGLDAEYAASKFGLVYRIKNDSVGFNSRQLHNWLARFLAAGNRVVIVTSSQDPKTSAIRRTLTMRVSPGTLVHFVSPIPEDWSDTGFLVVAKHAPDLYVVCSVHMTTFTLSLDLLSRASLEALILERKPLEIVLDRDIWAADRAWVAAVGANACIHAFWWKSGEERAQHAENAVPETLSVVFEKVAAMEQVDRGETSWSHKVLGILFCYLSRFPTVSRANATRPPPETPTSLDRVFQRWMTIRPSMDAGLRRLHIPASTLLECHIISGPRSDLLHALDSTITPFGRRQLRHDLCHPPADPGWIERRQRAVRVLAEEAGVAEAATAVLTRCKGLERCLQQAVVTEDVTSLAEVVVRGLDCSNLDNLGDHRTSGTTPPSLDELVELLAEPGRRADSNAGPIRALARAHDLLRPTAESLSEATASLEARARALFRDTFHPHYVSSIVWSPDRPDRVTIANTEMQSAACARGWTAVGHDFTSEDLQAIAHAHLVGRQQLNAEASPQIFDSAAWALRCAIQGLGFLDTGLALSRWQSRAMGIDISRPTIAPVAANRLTFVSASHPLLAKPKPNDLDLAEDQPVLVLFGANTGGKSTFLRQTVILTLLAHLGANVPAASASISPVTAVRTLLSTGDHLNASTFQVEAERLAEALKIADRRTLLALDEVGRGTATQDGLAIAAAVVRHLAKIGARTVFTTHYHKLQEMIGSREAQFGWISRPDHRITEARVALGWVRVAMDAGIPQAIIRRAVEKTAAMDPVGFLARLL